MTPHPSEQPGRPAVPGWLLICLIVVVATNLRPAVTSLAPFLDDVRDDLHISGAAAGALTALPALCFAVFGALTPALARRLGARLLVGAALLIVTVGLVLRALAPNGAVFFAASAVALAAMAVGNVLVPALIRLHFPRRIGTVTGLYSMGLSLGTAGPAAVTVPLGHAFGQSWRGGLGSWAALAVVAAVPWLVYWPGRARTAGDPPATTRASGPKRSRLPLQRSVTARSLALFFGAQALSAYVILGWVPQIYRDAGVSAGAAGLLLALITGLSIPVAFVLPSLAARRPNQGPLAVALTVVTGVGYLGLAFAPANLPWLWALLLGLGNGCFPLAITMISLRARVAGNTAALSGFVQGSGYLFATMGPLAAGSLYQATGGWSIPLALLGVFLLPQALAGYLAGRPRYIEDDLTASPDRPDPAGDLALSGQDSTVVKGTPSGG